MSDTAEVLSASPVLTVIEGGETTPPTDTRALLETAIAASIARIAFMEADDMIPDFTRYDLREGNQRVAQRFGAHARRAVVGPDFVMFPERSADVITGRQVVDLLGHYIRMRRLASTGEYGNMGFLVSDSMEARSRAAVNARAKLELVTDSSGEPLIHTTGKKGGARSGIDDVLVLDVRHTPQYKDALKKHSAKLSYWHVIDGAPLPSFFDDTAVLGARDALRLIHVGDLNKDQWERYQELSLLVRSILTPIVPAELQRGPVQDPEIVAIREKPLRTDPINRRAGPKCHDPDLMDVFFPPSHVERKDEREIREGRAKRICEDCPVRVRCLEKALKNRESEGVWGGTTPIERKRLLGQSRRL